MFIPYAADAMHKSIRRKHFRDISEKMYTTFDQSFWEDQTGKTVRISCDEVNSQLAYVDFLDYTKNKANYFGPTLPINLMLAGNGTLDTPYRVNFTQDPLAKSLLYLNKDKLQKKLPPFFENLNSLLDKLCFYKFNRQTMKDLSDVIEWIELGNRTLFTPLNVKMTLYLFENSYQEVQGGSFKQRRRSLPLEAPVFDSFPDLFKRLIRFVQLKLLNKKSEIRFGLVFRSTNQSSKKRMEDRIRKITSAMASQPEDSVGISALYNSDDDESTEFQSHSIKKDGKGLKMEQVFKPNRGGLDELNRGGESLQDVLLPEARMLESTTVIHGT